MAVENPLSYEQTCCTPNPEPNPHTEKQQLTIEFLYLDLTECDRCKGTNQQLEDALSLLTPVLEAGGFETTVRATHVQSEQQAAALGFVVSPTIRVNGRDIQLNWRETPCQPCSQGCATEVACREWEYRGQWYTVPPRELIIDAILRDVYGNQGRELSRSTEQVPDNLKRFFAKRPCCAT
jgi:hypothetical protein